MVDYSYFFYEVSSIYNIFIVISSYVYCIKCKYYFNGWCISSNISIEVSGVEIVSVSKVIWSCYFKSCIVVNIR